MCAGTATGFNAADMAEIGTPSGSRFEKGGLTAGTYYWFQVCAVGTGDQRGPWSDPAVAMAV